MADLEFAATEEMILARLDALKCTRAGATLTAYLYKSPSGGHFHVPMPLQGGLGYSSGQIAKIANALEALDLELLPLDINA